MISIELARELAAAGLTWTPANGDRFFIPDRDLDEEIFAISEMTVDVRKVPGGKEIAFNGAAEWALDAIEQHHVVWLPSEAQLREALGDRFVALERSDAGYTCLTNRRHQSAGYSAADAADAYALALLDRLNRQP